MKRLILAVLVAAAIAGCGGDRTSFNSGSDARYTEQQVATLAHFTTSEDGLSWSGGGCSIGVIMTTRPAVKMYADAGDAVVTNPRGDVGVKFSPDPGCREALTAALRSVK